MANILVTGGTGLIGSSITDHLARARHKVVTYDLLPVPDNVDLAAGDVTLLTGLPILPLMDGRRAERDFGFVQQHRTETAFAEMIAAFRARG